jgi:EpsD family peptidyl-prolyl cis-trans isomerase
MVNRTGVVILAGALALLGACGKEATGQSVAVVGDEEVSLAELNAELARARVPENADKKEVMPQLLQRIVDRKLLAKAATEQGIDRSPEFLTEERRAREELLINMLAKRQADSIKLPSQAEIDRYIAQNPTMFQQRAMLSLNQLQFAPVDARVLKQLEDDHSLEEVAATLTSNNVRFATGTARLDTGTVPPQVAGRINALPPGEPFIVPSNGRMVASVITGRQAATLSPEQSRALAAEAIRRQKLVDMMKSRVEETKRATEIKYQPGYEPKAAPKGGAAEAKKAA